LQFVDLFVKVPQPGDNQEISSVKLPPVCYVYNYTSVLLNTGTLPKTRNELAGLISSLIKPMIYS